MMHGIESSERRERSRWKWWNVAAAAVGAGVLALLAAGAYSFWWMFIRE